MNTNDTTTNTQQPNTPTPEETGGTGRLFTQEQVNAIVQDRLAREREKLADDGTYRAKYEALQKELEGMKAAQLHQQKEDAYRALLTKAEINPKRFPIVLRASGVEIDALELDENGAAVGADKLVERIKEDWADFVLTTITYGADIAHPPYMVHDTVDEKIRNAFKPPEF